MATKPFRPPSRDIGGTAKEQVFFGVDWDLPTIQILNAIVLDILSYQRFVPNSAELLVVCKDAKFLKRITDALHVNVTDDTSKSNACTMWKLYYVKECPPAPPQSVSCYKKQVTNLQRKKIILRQGQPRYPTLINPGDNRIVPPGKSPNINKIPPRVPNNQPSMLYQPF
jgi:hypothetical protein